MSGYLLGLNDNTGFDPFDQVIKAVITAGNAYHHTGDWIYTNENKWTSHIEIINLKIANAAQAIAEFRSRLEAAENRAEAAEAKLRELEAQKPVAWAIPGLECNCYGWIDAKPWKEGEFTQPLYAAPKPASISNNNISGLLVYQSKAHPGVTGTTIGADGSGDKAVVYINGTPEHAYVTAGEFVKTNKGRFSNVTFIAMEEEYSGMPIRVIPLADDPTLE